MLSFRDVRVVRGDRTVLRVDSLDLPPGLSVLAGPNGAGKSTLLLAVAGLVDLEGGTVSLDGAVLHDGTAPAPLAGRRRTALLFQEPYLMSGTVRAAVEIGLKLRKVPAVERRQRVQRVLERLDISHLAGKRTTKLSGGERRKVALAQALVLDTEVLLLDEVTVNLDEESVHTVIDLLKKRVEDGRRVVLLATHDAHLATMLHASVYRVDKGRMVPQPCEQVRGEAVKQERA
ncbi:MAG: ABC transporter ATP-binding protein [Deltaproteobacteria bacterium]|nr:ABC transporter ATP-binding protein [Deltaproteobacteria bacterium]